MSLAQDVEDSLRAEMEATKQHCQKRVYELEEKSSEEFKAHAAALERLSAGASWVYIRQSVFKLFHS